MGTIILIVLVILLLGGGGFGYSRYGYGGGIGIGGLLLLVLILEPIQKVVESEESVVIRYMVPLIERGTRCGPQSTAD